MRSSDDMAEAGTALVPTMQPWVSTMAGLLDAALLVDGDGRVAFANQAALTLLGAGLDETLGKRVCEFQLGDASGSARARGLDAGIQDLAREGGGRLECRLARTDGSVFDAELTVSAVGNGQKPLALLMLRDVTLHVRLRHDWAEQRRQFLEAQRIGNIGHWTLDMSQTGFHVSDRVYAMYEIDPAVNPVPMSDLVARVHPQDVERVQQDFAEALRSLGTYEHVFRLQFADGREKTLQARGEMTRADGGGIRVVGVVQDITALVHAQRERDRVASVLDITTDMVLMAGPQGEIFFCNRAATEMLGHRSPSRLGDVVRALWPEAAAQQMAREAFPSAIREGRWVGETAVLDAQGQLTPMSLSILAHGNEAGELQFIAVLLHDISEQRAAQASLEHQRHLLDEAQELARMGSWNIEMPDRRVTWSRALFDVLGHAYGAVEPGIEAFESVIHPQDRDRVLRELEKDLSRTSDGVNKFSHRIVTPLGVRHVQQRISIVHDAEGRMARLFGTTADVTEITETKEQLRQSNMDLERRVAERTAQLLAINRELDTFAYSVSHDLKAPLRTIEGLSHCLEEDCSGQLGADGRQYVSRIRRGVLQMGELINGLLSYAKMERVALSPECIDLTAVVEEVLDLCEADIASSKATIRLRMDEQRVRADREGVQVVLRNLIGNALKFIGDVSAPGVEIGSRRDNDGVLVWVKDNGMGFDMQFHDRIFGLFQRLHGQQERPGTGVGLALVAKAMQRMEGRVWADSQPGAGATFYLQFPE